MLKVLIAIDYFLPGEKSGGPVRSLAAVTHHLRGSAEFLVLTRDRDLGEDRPYPDLPPSRWMDVAGAHCRYLAPGELSPVAIRRALADVDHDVLYLNGLFSGPFALFPLLLHRGSLVPDAGIVVAPRGQLDPGALAIRTAKKTAFLRALRYAGMLKRVTWHATTPDEASHIRRWFGSAARVKIAPNLRIVVTDDSRALRDQAATKDPRLRLMFLSRISPKKNLQGALEILAGVRSDVVFDIYGPVEDASHWRRCERLVGALPPNVEARYRGIVPANRVSSVLAAHDLLLLPTMGENYGHVIAEALAAGCAPLISDTTPWRRLAERGVGWDLPLQDPEAFRAVIEACAAEGSQQRRARADRAVAWMAELDADAAPIRQMAEVLDLAMAA